MKTILSMTICLLLFSQAKAQQQGIFEQLKFSGKTFFVQDTVFYTTSSEPFSGDCTYKLAIDSIRGNNYFISGKYDGNNKCMKKGAADTIRIGKLLDGMYMIHYSFVDISGHSETEAQTTSFTVSPQSIQTTEKMNDFVFQNEGKDGIVFTLKNKGNDTFLLYICDIDGKENKAYSMERESLKISNLSPGIYLYRLENKNRVLCKGKFSIGK